MIAKQPTKQQEIEDISKGSVVLQQFGEENKCKELSRGSLFVSSKVNPQEASRPNCEQEHELTTKCNDAELNHERQPAQQKVKERLCYFCRKFGHIARDCFKKKLTKQQETKDISKGSVELQLRQKVSVRNRLVNLQLQARRRSPLSGIHLTMMVMFFMMTLTMIIDLFVDLKYCN